MWNRRQCTKFNGTSYITQRGAEAIYTPEGKKQVKAIIQLVEMAAKLGRQTRPDIHLGICGEHGGDPTSVEFCHKVGLNYVSCSPFRVPIARLAAAQAAVKEKRAK